MSLACKLPDGEIEILTLDSVIDFVLSDENKDENNSLVIEKGKQREHDVAKSRFIYIMYRFKKSSLNYVQQI